MNETKLVNRFNGEDALRDVETGYVFGECVVLDQHGHEVSSRQELHDKVEVRGILEGIIKLHDPWRVGFCENVAFCADVCQLE